MAEVDNNKLREESLKKIASLLAPEERPALSEGGNENRFAILAGYLDGLINTNFNRLLSILYRVDVSEEKLRKALAYPEAGKSAGEIIAQLLIDRELEKIKTRAKYKQHEKL